MKKSFKIEEPEYVFFQDFAHLLAEEDNVKLVSKVGKFERLKIYERRLLEFCEFLESPGSAKGGILFLTQNSFSALKQQREHAYKLIQAVENGEVVGLIVDANTSSEILSMLGSSAKIVPIIVYKGVDVDYFKKRVNSFLSFCFSPFTTCHGSAVEVYGEGVLLMGESGVGKSECLLELIGRGHLFVADDLVKLVNYPPSSILLMSGSPNESFKFFMELRGIGIIDVLRTFGPSRVKDKSELSMIVEITTGELDKGSKDKEESIQLFGKNIPFHSFSLEERGVIPTRIETTILEHKLKKFGFDTAKVIRSVFGG